MSESGNLYGMLLSLAGSGQGIEQNNANIDAALHHQEIENEKTRHYNLKLAEKQNQWNIEMFNRQNAYNSPEQQVSRLRAAGLNPDMMMGGGISNTSTSLPQMTAGSAATPMDWSALANKRSIGDTIQQSLQNQLTQAQIDNINADTKNKGHEGSILASDAAFRDAVNAGVVKTQNVEIDVKNKSIEFTDYKIKESQAIVRQLDASCNLMSQQVSQIQNAMSNDNARLALEKAFNEANIKKLASSVNLDNVTANNIASQLERILRKYDDEHNISEKQVINLGHEGDVLEIEKGIVKFKSGVLFDKKRDLNSAQQYIRFSEELMKSLVSSL